MRIRGLSRPFLTPQAIKWRRCKVPIPSTAWLIDSNPSACNQIWCWMRPRDHLRQIRMPIFIDLKGVLTTSWPRGKEFCKILVTTSHPKGLIVGNGSDKGINLFPVKFSHYSRCISRLCLQISTRWWTQSINSAVIRWMMRIRIWLRLCSRTFKEWKTCRTGKVKHSTGQPSQWEKAPQFISINRHRCRNWASIITSRRCQGSGSRWQTQYNRISIIQSRTSEKATRNSVWMKFETQYGQRCHWQRRWRNQRICKMKMASPYL